VGSGIGCGVELLPLKNYYHLRCEARAFRHPTIARLAVHAPIAKGERGTLTSIILEMGNLKGRI
jgi:hypothetical protein